MKKSTLKTKIKDLGKYLNSDSAQSALKILQDELQNYVEPKSGEPKEFVVPKELKENSKALAIFSDGGCRGNPGPGAYGFLVQNPKGEVLVEQAEFYEMTTNNKMELQAVISGLEYVYAEHSPSHTFVYTDSKYVVDGMNSWVEGWKRRGWKKADKKEPENLELWKRLDELREKKSVSFLWVKGHAGHPQNERADQLANESMDDNGC